MKRIKKILCFCLVFTLVIASGFCFSKNKIANAVSYSYEGTYYQENNIVSDNSISSFENVSATFKYNFKTHINTTSSYNIFGFSNLNPSSSAVTYFESKEIYINFYSYDNIRYCCKITSNNPISVKRDQGVGTLFVWLIHQRGYNYSVDFEFSLGNYIFVNTPSPSERFVAFEYPDNVYSFPTSDDFSSLLDFSSSDNFDLDLDLNCSQFSSLFTSSLNHTTLGGNFLNCSMIICKNVADGYYYGTDKWSFYDNRSLTSYFYGISAGSITSQPTFNIEKLRFNIYRPVLRVNNILTFYVNDYASFCKNITGVSYVLSRDSDLYTIYKNSSLPNSRILLLYSSGIENIIFDSYITLDISSNFQKSFFNSLPYDISIPLGFKFNFNYYAPPLISSNGSYNYTFEKPSYVDGSISFSIAPPRLNFPILAWVENIIIFLSFYCPITSDIVSLIHLDLFFGGLISVLNFFINSGVGDFILSCLAFLLFYFVLKSLLPSIVSSAGAVYSNTQFAYNRRRNKQEKNKIKSQNREERYQKKLEKVNDKRRHKVN